MGEQGGAAGPSGKNPREIAGSAAKAGAPAGGAAASADAPAPAHSMLSYAPAFVLLAIVIANAAEYADIDLWGHIRFGQAILALGRLPRHDHYAYSIPGPLWRNHEWLTDVVLAAVYDAVGILGLKALKFVCAGLTIVMLCAALAETGAALAVQFIVLLLTAIALIPQMQFRPQLFDYLFLAAIIAMLARESYGRRRAPLWLAVPMLALWANLHGGFFIGLAALGLYTAAVALEDLWRGVGLHRALRPGLICAAAALATLCNPWGIEEWLVVMHTLHNPYTMGQVSEFQPLLESVAAFHRRGLPVFTFLAALAMFVALALAVAFAPRGGDDLGLLAIAALMIAAAFDAVRNTALAVIAAAPPLARHARLTLTRLERRSGAASAAPAAPMRAALQALVAAAALAIAAGAGLFSSTLRATSDCPVGAVDFMLAHGLYGKLLGDHSWGDYLIWHEAPRSRVFIDSRFEMVYPLRVQRDYLAFASGSPAAAAHVLAAYPSDFVLMPTGSPAARMMTSEPGWKLIYRDPVAALFARAGSPAARVAGVPVSRDTAPPSFFP